MDAKTRQLPLLPLDAEWHATNASWAANKSLSVHRWANWIAGFSGEFVHSAISQYLPARKSDSLVMDPFAGVGTTLLEAFREGIDSVGVELNPFAALVSRVKLSAPQISVTRLDMLTDDYLHFMEDPDPKQLTNDGSNGNRLESKVFPKGFRSRIPLFSPTVEAQVLRTLEFVESLQPPTKDVFRVAFASVMIDFSNYSYEPSLGSRPSAGKKLIEQAAVGRIVSEKLRQISCDINFLQQEVAALNRLPNWQLFQSSMFDPSIPIAPGSVDLVVTSPPYMNNYHYIRNTRPQLFWLGFVSTPEELRRLEENNFGKFWQTVRAKEFVAPEFNLSSLGCVLDKLRLLNTERGVYGGNGWANYVTTYMNDLNRFCSVLRRLLRPSGVAVIVVGNSVIQGIEVKVEEHLAELAEQQGLSVLEIAHLRTRVGSSIVNTGARIAGSAKPALYDAAVVLRQDH